MDSIAVSDGAASIGAFDFSGQYKNSNSGYEKKEDQEIFYYVDEYKKTSGDYTTTYEEKYLIDWENNDAKGDLDVISSQVKRNDENGKSRLIFDNEADYENGKIKSFKSTEYHYDSNNKKTGRTERIDNNYDGIYETVITHDDINNKTTEEHTFVVDGKIDDFEQGSIGDCWLLASLDSLSTTEAGSKLIKDAIQVNDDESYTVNFKGVNASYNISKDEMIEARGENRVSGDDDVLLLELAYEKVYDDIDSGKIKTGLGFSISRGIKNTAMNIIGENDSSITCGQLSYAMFPLTGKTANEYKFFDDSGLNHLMNNSSGVGVVTTTSSKTVKDVNGKTFETAEGPHVMSIQKVTEDTVTITNPHDSSEAITLSRSEFKKMHGSVSYYDL